MEILHTRGHEKDTHHVDQSVFGGLFHFVTRNLRVSSETDAKNIAFKLESGSRARCGFECLWNTTKKIGFHQNKIVRIKFITILFSERLRDSGWVRCGGDCYLLFQTVWFAFGSHWKDFCLVLASFCEKWIGIYLSMAGFWLVCHSQSRSYP